MINRFATPTLTRRISRAAAAFLLCASPLAWASPAGDGHHGMTMSGGGHGMSEGSGMQPHNAASHFLDMAPMLKLTEDQTKQLTKLRDDYLEKNATAEAQHRTAHTDLKRALFADSVDLAAVNALLEKIGKLDAQLWRAFAQQLHDIKALLTAEQKKAMSAKWEQRWQNRHGSGGMKQGDTKPGEMKMDDDMHHKGKDMH